MLSHIFCLRIPAVYKPKTNAADDQLVFNSISGGSRDFRLARSSFNKAFKGRFSHIGFNNGYRNTVFWLRFTAKESISRLRKTRFGSVTHEIEYGRQIRHLLPQVQLNSISEAKFNNSSRNLAISLRIPAHLLHGNLVRLHYRRKSNRPLLPPVTNQVYR
jgi:hypothetical protein